MSDPDGRSPPPPRVVIEEVEPQIDAGRFPTKRVMGTVTTIVPVGLAASVVKTGVTGSHIGMGEVSFEGELLDSQTKQVLAAAIDKEAGKKFRIDKSVSKWGHHKKIFEGWAKTLRERLDRLSSRER